MSHDIETTFYTQGLSIPNKLDHLVEKLTEICDRIDDISYEVSKDKYLNR
jgi:hypothetical protein